MLNEDAYDSIVGAIYEAALDPKLWPIVVDTVTSAFGGVGASVFTPFCAKLGLEPIWSTNADPEFIAEYASKWSRTDILFPGLLRRIPSPSFVYVWDDLVDRKDLEAWEGYPALLRQNARQGIGLMVNTEGHRAGQLMVYTSQIDGPEIDAIKHQMKRLEHHLDRALRVHWHLAEARRTQDMATMTLDMFRTGAVWLSAAGEVLYTNQEMDAIFAKRDGLYHANGQLSFWDRGADKAMSAAIKEAMEERTSAFAVDRPSGGPALRVNVMPLPVHATALRLGKAAAIAFIAEAQVPTEASVAAASRIYGLTPAEARVMEQLVTGLDARQIADKSGTSIHTVRTQVKTILAKTDVKRQADLILLVTTLPQIGPS